MPSSARCTNFREGRPAAAQREAIQYDNHPDEVGTICHGTAVTGIAESPSVPEGQPKSALALIHRPPRTARRHERAGARQSDFFSSTGRGAFSFWARPKREWGAHPRGNGPLRKQFPRGQPPAAHTPPGMSPTRHGSFSGNLRPQAVPCLPDIAPGESPAEQRAGEPPLLRLLWSPAPELGGQEPVDLLRAVARLV